MSSDFEMLLRAAQDNSLLLRAYDGFLKQILARPLWSSGSVTTQRVLWSQGLLARNADRLSFESPGLYIWGSEQRPLYIGKAERQTLGKRFSRYIWSKRSQCNLAKNYASELIARGTDGLPPEVLDWYRRNFRGSTVRLKGAERFAREGIDSIWFALLPHSDPNEIKALEQALIPVAQKWNKQNGLGLLLNKDFAGQVPA